MSTKDELVVTVIIRIIVTKDQIEHKSASITIEHINDIFEWLKV